MVVVKIELWPRGDERQAREIGRVRITNDGTGDSQYGNYDAELAHAGRYAGRPGVWKRGRVGRHYRDLSPYHLVARALAAALRLRF